MSDGVPDLLRRLQEDPQWTEISGDDFAEQEREDGMRFDASVEVRETQPAGWQSHYFAILDENGDWDDPYEGDEADDEDEAG